MNKIVELEEGQYTPIPESPQWVLTGPGKLALETAANGKIAGRVVSGKIRPIEFAVIKKLRRISW